MTHFVKSHGLGNDYLVVDPEDLPFSLTPARVQRICHRHLGIGSDGILVLAPASRAADVGLRIFNPDGSEAEKSGNGIRIFAKWLFDTGRIQRSSFRIETPGGVVPVEVEPIDGRVRLVTADMGQPVYREDLSEIDVGDERLPVVAVSMGNPHCVIPRDTLSLDDLRRLGPLVERHAAFPNRTNVQLARVVNRGRVEAFIWERGAGETLASGSSSCAVAAAFQRLGLVDDSVAVSMPGGELAIRRDKDGHLWMRGAVEEVAHLSLSPELIRRLRALG